MLIFPPVTMHIDRWLKQGSFFSGILLAGLCMVLLLICIFYPSEHEQFAEKRGSIQKQGRANFSYEAIGQGGLALRPRHAFGWISRLADELVLIAYNSRPDVESQHAKILISLKNGKQQLAITNGSMIYLKESEQGKGLLPSEDATNLWVKPLLLDNGAVLIEAGRKFLSKDGEAKDEKGQFIVSGQNEAAFRFNPSNQSFFKILKSGRGFGYDLLLRKYGGREFGSWAEKAVIELSKGTSTYACFVSVGDYLLYENGEWHVCSFEKLKKDLPVASIKAISQNAVDIEMWDEIGFCPLQIKVAMEKQGYVQPKPEMMPSTIRLRNGTQVSCAFGKRRMILKQGDWLLKTAAGWRNLRRTEEIEQYLHHRLKGDLLIFDGIEKEQGRYVMKGHLFDETRMQMTPYAFPIETDRSQNKSFRKRKPIFSTLSNIERRVA